MAKEYNLSKTSGLCVACGKELTPGDEFIASLTEAGEEFQREDFCPSCWQGRPAEQTAAVLGFWHSSVPQPNEKKKLFLDDDVLLNFFERLEGAEEPAKINFRFVLTLVLMRKRLLKYERSCKLPDGRDAWTVRRSGSDQTHEVIDPHMDEDRIAEVSEQLNEILEGVL